MAVYCFSDDFLVVRNDDSAGRPRRGHFFVLDNEPRRHNIRFRMGGRDSELRGREGFAVQKRKFLSPGAMLYLSLSLESGIVSPKK